MCEMMFDQQEPLCEMGFYQQARVGCGGALRNIDVGEAQVHLLVGPIPGKLRRSLHE